MNSGGREEKLGTCVGGWDGHEGLHEQRQLCVHWQLSSPVPETGPAPRFGKTVSQILKLIAWAKGNPGKQAAFASVDGWLEIRFCADKPDPKPLRMFFDELSPIPDVAAPASSEGQGAPESTSAIAAEREFLSASVAVWRELDEASPHGIYVGQPLPIHDMQSELRIRERKAWLKYRDTARASSAQKTRPLCSACGGNMILAYQCVACGKGTGLAPVEERGAQGEGDERAEFEKWVSGRPDSESDEAERDGKRYKYNDVSYGWEAWQARARSASSQTGAKPDAFDWMGQKMARVIVEVATLNDHMAEPYRSGAITALEEFYFRMTNGKHFNWEEIRDEVLASQPPSPAEEKKR